MALSVPLFLLPREPQPGSELILVHWENAEPWLPLHLQKNSPPLDQLLLPVLLFFLKMTLYIDFWLWWVVAVCRLSLIVARGALFVAACSLLIAVASLVAEHRLLGTWNSAVAARRLGSRGSQA